MAINLEECGILRDDILNGVVSQLVESLDEQLNREIDNQVRSRVGKRIEELVDQKISQTIDSYLEKEIQPVNIWGEAVGKKQTLQEMLSESLGKWWIQKVDRAGKPTSGYDAYKSRVEFYLEKVVTEVLNNEMKKELEAVIQDAKTNLKNSMLATIKTLVERNLGQR